MIFKKYSERFLKDFFCAGDNHPEPEAALTHFRKAFIKPSLYPKFFENIKNKIDSNYKQRSKNIIIIDGHPRSGKTWATLYALYTIVDEMKLKASNCWTSGFDSLRIAPRFSLDLKTTLKNLTSEMEKISHRSNLRFIFLDEILGTNKPRPVSNFDDYKEIGQYFLLNNNNPILNLLPYGCSMIITGRALFFLLAETVFGIKIRTETNTLRWGIFRSGNEHEVVSAFNSETLKKACKSNLAYHPFREKSITDNLILSTPILGFSNIMGVDSRKKSIAAHVLFGEDMDSLSEIIEHFEKFNPATQILRDWRERVIEILETAYLMTISPGLIFLGNNAYESLGLNDATAKELAQSMYYLPTKFRAGRLPNQFYMQALDKHLSKKFPLAVRTFKNLLDRRIKNNTPELTRSSIGSETLLLAMGLALRGFIERALFPGTEWSIDELWNVEIFSDLFKKYQESKKERDGVEDFLLNLELHHHSKIDYEINKIENLEICPGLTSAVGWALNKFIQYDDQHGNEIFEDALKWFTTNLNKLILDLITKKSEKNGADLREKEDTITIFYSTFLQWGFWNKDEENAKKIVKCISEYKFDISNISSEITGIAKLKDIDNKLLPYIDEINNKLQMIFDDELIWALLELDPDTEIVLKYPELRALDATEKMLLLFKKDPEETKYFDSEINFRIVNLYFSLVWHNEWMTQEIESGGIKDIVIYASNWIKSYKDYVEAFIHKDYKILDANLQYHWCHFITQRSTWMRDWCFHHDPNVFDTEISKITKGTFSSHQFRNKLRNKNLIKIFYIILDEMGKSLKRKNKEEIDESIEDNFYQRIKNILMFIGTRTARLRFKAIIDKLDDLIKWKNEVNSPVIHAIFELSRQLYFTFNNVNTANNFRAWCREKIISNFDLIRKKVWNDYWQEISMVTYSLDLLPRERDGWKDILPEDWVEELEKINIKKEETL